MPETSLRIDTELPFTCHPTTEPVLAAAMEGNLLLLRLANQLEAGSPEGERDKLHDRLEAKLDLLLYWLGQALFANHPAPPPCRLRLDAGGVEWVDDAALTIGEAVVVELHLHPRLAGPVRLPATLLPGTAGRVRAEFRQRDEALTDAWTQWLFRRHRRSIQAARDQRGA